MTAQKLVQSCSTFCAFMHKILGDGLVIYDVDLTKAILNKAILHLLSRNVFGTEIAML